MQTLKETLGFALALRLGLVAALITGHAAWARPFERVPQDGTLQQALDRVSEGGIIEIAGGVYPAPGGGFRSTSGKRFTVRAAAGEPVVLDGRGSGLLFLLSGQSAGSVGFEGLTFRDGFSAGAGRNAITIENAEAVFASCVFERNVYDSLDAGGGAIRIKDGSRVRFVNSRFEDNRSRQFGGAIFAQDSTVEVTWSDFTNNRVNLPNHGARAVGGAIVAIDSTLTVTRSRFDGNQAAAVGGAIYAIGNWLDPEPGGDEESTVVTIRDSTFVGNRVMPDACCAVPFPPGGGAIHVEDQTRLEIHGSRFDQNVGTFGGCISAYRAVVVVVGSVFRGNRAIPRPPIHASGGTFSVGSSDFADASTDFGAINRRPVELDVTGSLIQGRFGATGVAAREGGCLFSQGDLNRLTGNGVPQDGTAADNRARLRFDDVIFSDCDVETSELGTGVGGAMAVSLVDLEMGSSMIIDSDALGEGAVGGAVLALNNNRLIFNNTAFARNSAEQAGGALLITDGHVVVRDSLFLDNDVSPGVMEPVQQSPGSALVAGLGDLTGVVEGTTFSGNTGIPIVDRDSVTGPFNRIVYNGNRIHSTSFGEDIYKNLAVGFGGLTADELNNLVLARSDGTVTVKSDVPNVFLPTEPSTGQLVSAPANLATAGSADADATPTGGFLGYAWSGPSATLAGQGLPQTSGLVEIANPGTYALRVAGNPVDSVTVGRRPCSRDQLLCLNQERFVVEVDWRAPNGQSGRGNAVFSEEDSGIIYFFSANNWEMLVKVLDGCSFTNHFWVFAAATTDVEYTLRVTDTLTGISKSYFNRLGNAAAAITDTSALPVCSAVADTELDFDLFDDIAPTVIAEPEDFADSIPGVSAETEELGNCTPSDTHLCLNSGRFQVEIDWRTATGTGVGEVVPFGSDDSGLFYFFNAENWELLIKVLNGCDINNRFWVFAAATTDVGYTLKVTDTERNQTRTYINPLGVAADAITDTSAFATCP